MRRRKRCAIWCGRGEAAKQDQLRHRHQLGKFLLRHGKRPTDAGPAWSAKYLNWIKVQVRFEQAALEATLADYLHEVEHAAERIIRLEQCIEEAVAQATPEVRAVIEALQALRGVAHLTAATVVAELGSLARFENPRQLMGYSGLVPREHSSGNRTQRGAITKPEMRICAGFWWRRPGPTGIGPRSTGGCYEGKNR
jgi:transposase